jgi:hypothetical protein
MRLSQSHNLDRRFYMLTLVDLDQSNILLFQYYFFKKKILEVFLVKLCFFFSDYRSCF